MNIIKYTLCALTLGAAALVFTQPSEVSAHGDVAPQAVNTEGLPKIEGDEWLTENPWRDPKGEYWAKAVEIGASGYNQNCARCHGLEAVSGGLAPDLRLLEADESGDEWYIERFTVGVTQNGITKMPAFGELLGQEAAWAIRTYLETRPDEDALAEAASKLKEILHKLEGMEGKDSAPEIKGIIVELNEISAKIETASGAPLADSPASRAANFLDGSEGSVHKAVNALHIGLSVAQ
jgi:cytochrome c-550 PedF